MRSGSLVFQRTLIGAVEAGDALDRKSSDFIITNINGGVGIRLQRVELRLSVADRGQMVEEGPVGFAIIQEEGRRPVRIGLVEGLHERLAEQYKADLRRPVADLAVYLSLIPP